jgi:hypothetical protein
LVLLLPGRALPAVAAVAAPSRVSFLGEAEEAAEATLGAEE